MTSLPIILGFNRKKKWYFAHMALKNRHAHAIKIVVRKVSISGYSRLIMKSNQQPAVRELAAAARRERPVGVGIITENS